MIINSRRDFIKTSAVGAGVMLASNFWVDKLIAGSAPAAGKDFIQQRFGLSPDEIQKTLAMALSRGADFAELYFEYRISNSIGMEEDIIRSTSEGITLGVGIRVLKNKITGYGYTNDLTMESLIRTALSAAAIAREAKHSDIISFMTRTPNHQVYELKNPLTEAKLNDKIQLVRDGYEIAKNYDSKIKKVSASLADEIQYIAIANSEGLLEYDVRPQARLNVSVTAEDKGVRNTGSSNAGGRVGIDFYKNIRTPKDIAKKAAEEALILITAKNAPPGTMPVVLSKDESGVMIHEAVGHPLEADANWKKTSIMHDKMGQMVSNPIVTIYDDATIPNLRGSLNIDDEGTPTENAMLIEKGKLVGFLNDRLGAKILGHKMNGHARRESYMSPPIPRMNNTVLEKGDSDPAEIIKSVEKGFYAVSYQGGQVSGTGKFTFSVNLGYMIENGKLTYPLKNATLIGTNIEILKEISMVGNDMGFFLGTCGKDGQSVPVTCGTPTMKISKMTVGGVA